MKPIVAVLATLDTKATEAGYLAEQIEQLGGQPFLIDLGVIGSAGLPADLTREVIARAGGSSLAKLIENPTRAEAGPVMVAGATKCLGDLVARGEVHAVIGLGGTQGTSSGAEVMQSLPYGFPKVLVSTVASGDTSPFVDIKDITMMFSVSDILGLNPLMRKILANAAGAAWGMTQVEGPETHHQTERPVIGITNLGVLTEGTQHAIERFERAGYEVMVFHAVGSGGRAMEQLMKDGVIGAVFDYALGEISDELFQGLRAGSSERLTVAGELGLPQVLCPGGAEHIGLLVEPNTVPAQYCDHLHVFHSPVVLAPRLSSDQLSRVAAEIGARLSHTKGKACFFIPRCGTSRYSIEAGPLHDPDGDATFFEALEKHLPASVELVSCELAAESPEFVERAVDKLIDLIEQNANP